MKKIYILIMISAWVMHAEAQPAPMGEVFFICNSPIKEGVKPEAFKAYFTSPEVMSMGRKMPGTFLKLYQADRGEHKGDFLLTVAAINKIIRKNSISAGSPFSDSEFKAGGKTKSLPSDFLAAPDSYTEYEILGAGKIGQMPAFDLLGIHYIKVKKESTGKFEEFVIEELNPKVNRLFPDMGLFYYKAVSGENQGSYITIFAIKSTEAREKYWPEGKPETEELKAAFRPLGDLAKELGSFLEEGTYLKPESGGAAAFFESLNWTDYVVEK